MKRKERVKIRLKILYLFGTFFLFITVVQCRWLTQTIDSDGEAGYSTCIKVDKNKVVHIAYYTNTTLKYAKYKNGVWNTVIVDTIGVTAIPHSLGLDIDKDNNPHISYFDPYGGIGAIKYARYVNNMWNLELVVTNIGIMGCFNSIAIDKNDNPHISFADATNRVLKYAKKNTTNGEWGIEIVDSEEGTDGYSSIALDKNDYPHIAYYKLKTPVALKYAEWTGTTWYISVIDTNGWVGVTPSIKLDKNDNPHISYYDVINSNLKYAKWDGSTWYIETVDVEGLTGFHPWLALDKHDVPHISYYDATLKCLKVAKKVVDGWYIVVVDSSADVGQYSSIDIDMDGVIHISYFDNTNKDLKYAKLVNTSPELSWTGEENYVSGGVYPTVGDTSTTFVFRIRYTDIDNDPAKPGYPRVRIKKDGVEISSPFIMLEVDPSDTVYSDGKLYISSITLPVGRYSYSFEAYDIWDAIATGSPTTFFDGPYVNEPGIVVVNKGEVKVVGGASGRGTVNPDKGEKVEIFFKGEQVGKYVCKIFTINGVFVYEDTKDNITEGKFEWLPKDIATGTYLVYIEGPGIKYKKKVVILR